MTMQPHGSAANMTSLASRGNLPTAPIANKVYFYISDYFAFGDVVISTTVSDGHRLNLSNPIVSFKHLARGLSIHCSSL